MVSSILSQVSGIKFYILSTKYLTRSYHLEIPLLVTYFNHQFLRVLKELLLLKIRHCWILNFPRTPQQFVQMVIRNLWIQKGNYLRGQPFISNFFSGVFNPLPEHIKIWENTWLFAGEHKVVTNHMCMTWDSHKI